MFTRNVACCSPPPVIAVWYVPQLIGALRGPSSVCIGNEELDLPSIASEGCAVGGHFMGLNTNNENNAKGNF